MKHRHYIGNLSAQWSVLCILCSVFFLTSCKSTAKLPPIDDAYYWSDQSVRMSQDSPADPTSPVGPSGPSVEYLNIQDTTVTIRIKR